MNIFVLNSYSVDDLESYLPTVNPIPLFESNSYLGLSEYFSSEEKAKEEFLSKFNDLDDEDKESVLYYTISSYELDTGLFHFYKSFKTDGSLIRDSRDDDKRFFGEDNPKYKKGDYVLYIYNGELVVGLVIEPPPTTAEVKKSKFQYSEDSNVYFIAFANPANPKDDYPHSHLSENYILKKIEESEIKQYLEREQIDFLQSKLD